MTEVQRFGPDDESAPEVGMFEQKNGSPADVALVDAMSVDRIRSILMLWTSGANFAEIAHQFQIKSPAVVQIAVERALSEMVDDTTDRSKQRRKMSLLLERLIKAVVTKAVDPNHPEQLPAVRTILSIVERYSRMNNLDAPTEHVLHMPGGEEFQRFVEMAALGAGMSVPQEADPFSDEFLYAEVVDDEGNEDGEDDGGLAGPDPD